MEEERISTLEEEKMNPMQAMIGLTGLMLAVVIFCFVVWKITHINPSSPLPGQNGDNSQDSIVNRVTQSSETGSGENSEEESPESTEDPEPENALGMTFDAADEYVTAKDVTNLRSEPSTEQGQLTVVTQLSNGQPVHRTGINAATGWSRLEYNGQVVYAVSQYLTAVEEE